MKYKKKKVTYGSAYIVEMSPDRRASNVYGTDTLFVFSKALIKSNTETPRPVPKL